MAHSWFVVHWNEEATLTAEGGPSILGDPHQMQVDFEDCMRAVAIITHVAEFTTTATARVLKPSPKGEGFDPPRERQ